MTSIKDFNSTSTNNNNNNNVGVAIVDSFEPYTIDIPIPFGNEEYPSLSIFTKTVYGAMGESMGFGDGGFGTENYVKLTKFIVEYDLIGRVLYLVVPKDYEEEYELETVNSKQFKLHSLTTDYEFLIIIN